jgi:FixJ family two-component response regulator
MTHAFSRPATDRARQNAWRPGTQPAEGAMVDTPLVSVVDDDESIREALPDLLREFGYAVRAFSSAQAFLSADCIDETKCLILDIAMPGMSGPDLQRELNARAKRLPIIFITAHGDETLRPWLIEQGAVECLTKPFSDTDLRNAIETALAKK